MADPDPANSTIEVVSNGELVSDNPPLSNTQRISTSWSDWFICFWGLLIAIPEIFLETFKGVIQEYATSIGQYAAVMELVAQDAPKVAVFSQHAMMIDSSSESQQYDPSMVEPIPDPNEGQQHDTTDSKEDKTLVETAPGFPEDLSGMPIPDGWTPDEATRTASIDLPPHNGQSYPETPTRTVGTTWSYQVRTPNETYRISTIPDDFEGVLDLPWSQTLIAGYSGYHVPYHAFVEANADLKDEQLRAAQSPPSRPDRLYPLMLQMYDLLLQEATLRRDFLHDHPSAQIKDNNSRSHWQCIRYLINNAKDMRLRCIEYYRLANPLGPNDIPTALEDDPSYDEYIHPIYALSPQQYIEFRQKKLDEKANLRAAILDPNNYSVQENPPHLWGTGQFMDCRYPSIYFPNLPPLRTGLQVPAYTPAEIARLSYPEVATIPGGEFIGNLGQGI